MAEDEREREEGTRTGTKRKTSETLIGLSTWQSYKLVAVRTQVASTPEVPVAQGGPWRPQGLAKLALGAGDVGVFGQRAVSTDEQKLNTYLHLTDICATHHHRRPSP